MEGLRLILAFSQLKSTLAKAVAPSYLLASNDHLKGMVTYIRGSILTAFQNSKKMTLPPTSEDLK